jgi:nitrogen-specific signal transduction histidine kinase
MAPKSAETTIEDRSVNNFLDLMQSYPPTFNSGGNGISLEKGTMDPRLSSKTGDSEVSPSLSEGNGSFTSENEDDLFASYLKQLEAKPAESETENLPSEQHSPFLTSFLIELVHSIKNTLASISQTTLVALEKVDDPGARKQTYTQVKEDIKKIDSVLNSLLNFISVNTPIPKTNTLHMILEEILESNEKPLREKNIQIVKRFAKDLPETYIHNEQLRFILHSIFQYAILSVPQNETIAVLVKSLDPHKEADIDETSGGKGGYLEVIIAFNGKGKVDSPPENGAATPTGQREDAVGLILVLVKQILERNRGMMAVKTDGQKPSTLIGLRFPVERRNVVYYEPITL